MGKTTFYLANMDLCIVIIGALGIIYLVLYLVTQNNVDLQTEKEKSKAGNSLEQKCITLYYDMQGDGWMQIMNTFYMKIAVFSFL